MVNPSATDARDTEIAVRGAKIDELRDSHAHRAGARRAQLVRPAGRGPGAEGEPGDAPCWRRSRCDPAQGVGEQDSGHTGLTGPRRVSAGRQVDWVTQVMWRRASAPHTAVKRFIRSILLLAVLAAAHSAWSADAGRRVWVGTYTEGAKSKGIYTALFDGQTGGLSPMTVAAETPNPSFLAVHPEMAGTLTRSTRRTHGPEHSGACHGLRD